MLLKVAFLDVFHGDCAVVTFDEAYKKACIVIDGGEVKAAAKRLAAYLKFEKVENIDLMIATHIDSDHINGLIHLLESESNSQKSWNKNKKQCISHYWGPKPDPNWTKTQTVSHFSQQYSNTSTFTTMNFITQSIQQNQDLNELIKKHISNSKNIYYPSLENKPPMNLFKEINLELFAPDSQIMDSEIHKKAMAATNAPYQLRLSHTNSNLSHTPLKLEDLKRILNFNAEETAKIADRTANNQSIVVKLTPKATPAKKWSFLFSGDAEHESWDMMLNRKEIKSKNKLHSRVLKVPHHGSVNGINQDAFDKINPKYSIVSVGQKHGLPDGPTLNLIKSKKNMKLFCTERNNNKKKPGPCLNMNECIRKSKDDFRSIRFVIDTETGKPNLETFKINTKSNQIEIQNEEICCPAKNW